MFNCTLVKQMGYFSVGMKAAIHFGVLKLASEISSEETKGLIWIPVRIRLVHRRTLWVLNYISAPMFYCIPLASCCLMLVIVVLMELQTIDLVVECKVNPAWKLDG